VYLYGSRTGSSSGVSALDQVDLGNQLPVILYLGPGATQWTAQLDPKHNVPDDGQGGSASKTSYGTINSLSLAQGPQGVIGWALGDFHPDTPDTATVRTSNTGHAPLMQFDSKTG